MPKIVKPQFVDDFTGKPLEDESAVNVVCVRVVKKHADADAEDGMRVESIEHELYLSDTSVAALDKALTPFVDGAEVVAPMSPVKSASRYARNKETSVMREWWVALTEDERKSLDLPEPPPSGKGKLADGVAEAYEKTHAAK